MFLNNISICKNIYLIILIFIFTRDIIYSQEIPKVIDNNVYFLDGKTHIQLGSSDKYYISSENECFIYIGIELIPNLAVYTIKFFDFQGKIIKQEVIGGEIYFIFLPKNNRLLAGQKARLVSNSTSFLYDLNGNIIKLLTHDNPINANQIGITKDNKYFWFVFERSRLLKPGETPRQPWSMRYEWSQILVYDVISGDCISEYSTQDSSFSFILNGVSYTIPINSPR